MEHAVCSLVRCLLDAGFPVVTGREEAGTSRRLRVLRGIQWYECLEGEAIVTGEGGKPL